MAMETHTIKSMFESIYPIRSRLTEMLTATDLSTFCYTFDIELTDKEKDYYLRPIRDLVDQEEWIRSEVAKGTKISIVGTDLPLWIMRIKDPVRYWSTFKEYVTIRVWILAKMGDEEREKSENIVRSIELEIAEIRHAIMNSSEDWNVDTDLYNDVCTTLIRSLQSYEERMTYTLRPPSKFMLLSSSSSLSEIETPFGSTPFKDSIYEWRLYSGITHSSIDVLYARINIEWPAYTGPPSIYSRDEAVSWVPHSIVNANENEIETWIISLSKNSTTINCTDGTVSTTSHRSANKRDLFISATFADTVGNSWDNILPIEIGYT
ncbi:hypothetical protein LTR49_027288 [Elasticomyces elasticus]|nr:hypothetical protein LTR49_027288 [Elasticomyces elasticus]KAK5737395.1 hypothetical protein LTS12_025911 [Elasticomyces elasticus]